MTHETFAEYVHVSVRAVYYWQQRPDGVPKIGVQDLLNKALESAPEQVKAKFALLVEAGESERTIVKPNRPSAELNPEQQERIRGVINAPSRLDGATVGHLTQALYGQRHAEDSLGSSVMIGPMTAQLETLTTLLKEVSGPHRAEFMHLVANWTTFIGWLHTSLHEYADADATFTQAEEMADEIEDGILASTATSYRGYIALLQQQYRPAIRGTAAALATPNAHPVQVAYDTLQLAQAYAGAKDVRKAGNLLRQASDLVTDAGDPPESLYWYTEPFLRMNIGLTQDAIGQYREAVDSISSGIAELAADQQQAEWLGEYQEALDHAAESL